MRWSSALLCSLGAALLVSAPRLALATSGFPSALQGDLTLGYLPSCTLCHDGTPGLGTATQKFAVSMKERGLTPNDEVSLQDALDQMTADKVDSDADGKTDIDEIVAETDPNAAGTSMTTSVAYGCGGAQVARAQASAGAPWLVAAAVGIGLLAARRRRHADRG